MGWPTVPGDPVRLVVGARFDVLDVPAAAGHAALRHLRPGSPVALRGDRMRLLVAAGSAEELPGLLEWLEWGTLALDLRAIGTGCVMEAPLPCGAGALSPCGTQGPLPRGMGGLSRRDGLLPCGTGGLPPQGDPPQPREAEAFLPGEAEAFLPGETGGRLPREGGLLPREADVPLPQEAGSRGGCPRSLGRAGSQGAAVWLRPPEPGCEVEASLPTLSALGGGGSAPDLVRLVDTVATHCHRVRLRRA
ncbi:hypothetical protein KEF29_36525 [Streptomyces tuirus]|uniref:Proline-rich protein n=1 Tax=Streptomyces tuirus TaxID=68278 RepID=A0A941FGR8_9ACTN|nr:hypothetical protein [Streptomyces tuirus]